MTDSSDQFDELFLRQIARLLPDVDLVQVRHSAPSAPAGVPPPAVEAGAAQAAVEATSHATVGFVAGAWLAIFPAAPIPTAIGVSWRTISQPEVVFLQAVARRAIADWPSKPSPDEVAERVVAIGWEASIRSRRPTEVNVLGRRDGFRLDVVMNCSEDVAAVRVISPGIAVGELAGGLLDAGPGVAPWPALPDAVGERTAPR